MDGGSSRISNPQDKNMDKGTILAVLQFLKKHNLKGTEELLKKESGIGDSAQNEDKQHTPCDVSQALAAYTSEGDPSQYEDYYMSLKGFIEQSLDSHRCELSQLLYPVFVQMYLELVYNGHEQSARAFLEKFRLEQQSYYQDDLTQLACVSKPEHMALSQLMDNFRTNKFVIRMSRDSYTHLKRHLQEKQQTQLLNIIQEHLFIDVFDGLPRTKEQIDSTAGGLTGEARREANKSKVYYGLLKEPDINIPMDDDDDDGGEGDKPKKKKSKKDALLMRKSKNDPNAPKPDRIPLPDMRDSDKVDRVNAFREAVKRVKVSKESPPSICFYTFLNAQSGVTSVDISEDSTLISSGFADSHIRVWSLTPNRLRSIKPPEDLDAIDKEAEDILERIMDERTASESKLLLGHSGPVYATSFSRDKNELVSCSEDGTVRLWSLQTWSDLVCYKGHMFPVWDVTYSPHGHYFASAGHDRTARLWVTDHHQPVRIFAGHLSDVDCIEFHPNSNYIATGSSDRSVKLWDVSSGKCVRTMTGHKGAVYKLEFSPDGRYLASAGVDKTILLWDLANGNLVGQFKGHADTVYSLSFSRDGTVLASGGLDNCVKLWDVARVFRNQDSEGDVNVPSTIIFDENYEVASFPTKSTPVLSVHFTRRNLLLAGGPYVAS